MKQLKASFIALLVITTYNITAQVSINTDGISPEPSAGLEVKFIDKGFLPPRMTLTQREDISSPATGLMIYNTTTNKPNYFNGTKWIALDGSSAGVPSIGDYFLGGVVFYLDGSGGGLICAVIDQDIDQDGGSGIHWYSDRDTVTNAVDTVIGTGQANTTTIIGVQGAGSYAATVCDNYSVGAYSDWFLPSKNELNAMYQKREKITVTALEHEGFTFGGDYYWSSSECSKHCAWRQNFKDGSQLNGSKYFPNSVRAVRAF